MLYKVTNANMC